MGHNILPAIAAGHPRGNFHREKGTCCGGVVCSLLFFRFGVGAGEVCAANESHPELVQLRFIEQWESNGSQYWGRDFSLDV